MTPGADLAVGKIGFVFFFGTEMKGRISWLLSSLGVVHTQPN